MCRQKKKKKREAKSKDVLNVTTVSVQPQWEMPKRNIDFSLVCLDGVK